MIKVFDITTSDVFDYDDIDDFNNSAKYSFDDSVHGAIDEMCGAYKRGECVDAYEQFLGIRLVTDMSLDVYDLIDLYR